VGTGGQAWRRSRLEHTQPRGTLVVADLHNHSLFSDGLGDPEQAFGQLRAAGLDAAALTDHASIPRDVAAALDPAAYPDPAALALARTAPRSLDAAGWERTGAIADAHDAPGEFTALRGFEWTEPWLGHANVWFSNDFLPVTTPGSLSGLQSWLANGEPGALFGYNHPGREPGRLAGFALPDGAAAAGSDAGGLHRRMVAMEAFNRSEDFLFAGYAEGLPSAIVECLDAGWRPGLIGCSDEHGRSYGLAGKGRTGLWVTEHSRGGVRAALLDRATFATREPGLRLDATLDGVRPGWALRDGNGSDGGSGRLALAVDLDAPAITGRAVELQLLTSGHGHGHRHGHGLGLGAAAGGRPRLGEEVAVVARVPATAGEVTRVDVTVPDGASWLLLRVADPARRYGGPAPASHPCACWALAYATPWWRQG
jgi:Protein of unknown function (DUF3604)